MGNVRERLKGSAELWILSLLEQQARHGYDICKLIEARSGGALKFHVTTMYPLLYRLENRGLVQGRWIEKPIQRRRRYYSLTPEGRKVVARQRKSWQEFVRAIGRVMGTEMRDWKRVIEERLASLRIEPAREAAVVEELAQHLEDRYQELRSEGADDREASKQSGSLLDISYLNLKEYAARNPAFSSMAGYTQPMVMTLSESSGRAGYEGLFRDAGDQSRESALLSARRE
jgi:PadR family transcriptional regulator, regulatory protein PadR